MNLVREIHLFIIVGITAFVSAVLVCRYFQWQKMISYFGGKQRKKIYFFASILVFISFFLTILAYRGPYFTYDLKKMKNNGADISVVLDISNSMYAQDIAPSRLIRSKMAIKKLLKSLSGDRVSLVTFAGRAVRNSPLTRDYASLDVFLDEVDPTQIPFQGTNINEAIELGVKTLLKTEEDSRFLIFISDGESHKESLDKAINLLRENNIKLLVASVGSLQGAPVPTKGAEGENDSFKKDENGNIVLSKSNRSLLKKFANDAGGFFITGSNFDDEIFSVISSSLKKASGLGSESNKKLPNEVFQYFLLAAFVLFIFSKRLLKKSILLSAVIINCFFSVPDSSAFVFDKKSTLYQQGEFKRGENYLKKRISEGEDLFYELGNFYYRQKKFNEAKGAFLKSNNKNSSYNAGNSFFQMGEFDQAISQYEKFLREFPDDKDAKYNLELAKKMKQNSEKQNSEKQNSDKQNPDKKNTEKQNSDNQNPEKQNSKNQNLQIQNSNQNQKLNNQMSEKNKNQEKDKMSYRSKKLLNQIEEGRQKYQKTKKQQGRTGAYNGIDW